MVASKIQDNDIDLKRISQLIISYDTLIYALSLLSENMQRALLELLQERLISLFSDDTLFNQLSIQLRHHLLTLVIKNLKSFKDIAKATSIGLPRLVESSKNQEILQAKFIEYVANENDVVLLSNMVHIIKLEEAKSFLGCSLCNIFKNEHQLSKISGYINDVQVRCIFEESFQETVRNRNYTSLDAALLSARHWNNNSYDEIETANTIADIVNGIYLYRLTDLIKVFAD